MSKRAKARDFTMARLGAAVAQLDDARENAMGALQIFVEPDGPDPADRVELMKGAMVATHGAAVSLSEALEGVAHMRDDELAMVEVPEDEDDEEEVEVEEVEEDAEGD
jgi:hypothetical protein